MRAYPGQRLMQILDSLDEVCLADDDVHVLGLLQGDHIERYGHGTSFAFPDHTTKGRGPGVLPLPHVASAVIYGSLAISATSLRWVCRSDLALPAYCWYHGGAGMAKRSAALLVFRLSEERGLEVLLGHMGGPFWEKKE